MPNTIALFSSSRRKGNTGRLMDRIAATLDIEVVDLASLRITPYDYDHSNRDDDFEPLMDRVLAHGQIIFASPIYWYSVSPPMKIFIDRISDFLDLSDLLSKGRRLRGKNAFIVCTSVCDEASPLFMSAFRETFDYLGMRFAGATHVNCVDGYQPATHDAAASAFATLVRSSASAQSACNR
jgi:multimeric flavodoxin WrbA